MSGCRADTDRSNAPRWHVNMSGAAMWRRVACMLALVYGAVLGAAASAGASGVAQRAPLRFVVDADSSSMVLHTSTEELLGVAAGGNRIAFRRFWGEIRLVPDSLDGARLVTTIVADSLEVLDEATEDRRRTILTTMRRDVMETPLYPTIGFESTWAWSDTGVGEISVMMRSDLSLHGVTRVIDIPAAVTREGRTVRIAGEFLLRHSDFGMTPATFLGGLIRVQDEMLFRFDVRARED